MLGKLARPETLDPNPIGRWGAAQDMGVSDTHGYLVAGSLLKKPATKKRGTLTIMWVSGLPRSG